MIGVWEGREVMLACHDDDVIGRSVLATGQFEFELIETAIRHVGHRETLFDIGANIGTVCIPAITRKLALKAVAVEPDASNYRLLRANVILNGVDDVIGTHCLAAGNRDEMVTLELSATNHGDHRIAANGAQRDRQRRQVKMRRLGELFDATNRDLVCLDVQGCEADVLDGWPQLVERRVPLVVEICPYILREYDGLDRLLSQLRAYAQFVDLRADSSSMHISDLPAWVAALPEGTHRDVLVFA